MPSRHQHTRSRAYCAIKHAALLATALTLCAAAWSQSAPTIAAGGDAKAKAILVQAIAALGGDAYLHVSDMSQEGRTYGFYHGRSEGAGAVYWRFTRFPDKDRVEFTKERDVVTVHNGNKGYEISYKGTAPEEPKLLADFLRRRDHSLDAVLRSWVQQPGTMLLYTGTAIAEQKPADVVTVLGAGTESVTLYFDPHTHLPIKKTYSWRDPSDNLKNTEDEVYDAYKLVSGIMTPHNITRLYNGDMAAQRFLTVVRYNQSLPDSMFDAHTTYDPMAPRK